MERAIAQWFQDHHGVISRAQAIRLGLTDGQISRRLRDGRWERLHPGVYRLSGSPVTPEQAILAACLAAGPNAVASHLSAAYLWRLVGAVQAARPEVTVPKEGRPRLKGCTVHRSSDIDWRRVRERSGVPCTDPLRTIADLAAVVQRADLDAVIDRALASRLVSVASIEAELHRVARRGRKGVRTLRHALGDRGFVGAPNPSVLESHGLALLRKHGITVLGAEVKTGPEGEYRVDFLLAPDLVFELDGYVWHFSPEQKARDDRRRNDLQAAGIRVYVSNWLDVHRRPGQLARTLKAAAAPNAQPTELTR